MFIFLTLCTYFIQDDDDQATVIRVFENRVEVIFKKETPSWWPRLTAQPQKPAWLKVIGLICKIPYHKICSRINESKYVY